MHPLAFLPAVTLLTTAAWALPFKLPGFGVRKSDSTVPQDTIPPAWKPISRLALENRFVFSMLPRLEPRPGLKINGDPRRLRIEVDPDSGTISTQPELADVPVGPPVRLALETQARELAREMFRRQFREQVIVGLRMAPTGSGIGESGLGGQGLSFRFPSPLPKRVQSFLGPGGPAITVSGSENIKLSGQSNWTNQQLGPLGRKNSLFPSLDMQQDLDIRLEGQLSDRIRINLLQNSGVQIPLANRLAINYKGDEDDLVQALDLGNTNLTLPGTQYVSYSGRNEGLFGVKSSLKMGPLDFTVLASKQEGRSERSSYAGGSSSQTQTVNDFDYIRGQYFFLYDPNEPGSSLLIDPEEDIKVYLEEYGSDPNVGNKVLGRAFVDPTADTTGMPYVEGRFRLLNRGPDQDYELIDDFYGDYYKIIRLRSPITLTPGSPTAEHTLAVTYKARQLIGGTPSNPTYGPVFNVGTTRTITQGDTVVMKILRAPVRVLQSADSIGFYRPSHPFTPTRELELKNVYQLSGQNIDLSTFKLLLSRGYENPPDDFTTTPATGDTAIKYVEAVGLDVFDENVQPPVRGHDGRVDGTRLNTDSRTWVDPERGVLFFYDLRPFAPRIGPEYGGEFPFDRLVARQLSRRDSLVGAPGSDNEANRAIYEMINPLRNNQSRYFMDVEFTAQRATGEINLGRSNIIEGSDVVTINGVALTRDRDYTIDYDLGRVVLKRQLGPSDNLNVNYSYAPLFQQAGRTLLGSAFKLEGRDRALGGAFMYESKGATDLRPRLGEEPSRSLIGDLNTDLTFRPAWLTRMVDALPGVRTTAISDFRVQAEVGASFPNPNTKGEVYVDDMEGVRDAISASMGRERWRRSSIPLREAFGTETPLASNRNAEINWYAPQSAVEEKDLRPDLEEGQGAKNKRQVLALSIPRRPAAPPVTDSLWAGLTYPLDNVGLDLSRAQFIEIWVNDFNDYHHGAPNPRVRGRHVKLHVDLGAVSEDQQRAPDEPPNNKLDTEDVPPFDDQLDVSGSNNEDTGVDSLSSALERSFGVPIRDLTTANANDPEGDDYLEDLREDVGGVELNDIDPRKWRGSNGTEGNKNIDPYPDTEDLNGSDILESSNNYFEWTIDLGDSAHRYLITDVRRDFASGANFPPALDNGWRRYRIPINDSLRTAFGFPDLTYTRHLRIWIEGILESEESVTEVTDVRRPYLMLGGLDIVGSRWQNTDLTDVQKASGTTLTLNSVNTIDNADDYVAPFDPGRTRSGSQELSRREQSISMEFTQLAPDDTLEAYKTFSLDENYSRYGTLAWYQTAFEIEGFMPASDALWSFVRFASDELGRNYYEYKIRVGTSSSSGSVQWQDVELALTTLSNLKLQPDFPASGDILYRSAGPNGNDSLIIKGRPSFTRLRRVSFGLINPDTGTAGGRTYPAGQLWFDELRARNVAKDRGVAQRVSVGGNVANLFNYNVNWDGRDADFVTVGQSRGSGNSTDLLNAGGTFNPHRFFEATGILLPMNFSYSRNSSRPRFTAGDDVVRTGSLAEASETRSESRSFSTSYQRAWSDRSNPWLRYTLGGITAAYRWSDSDGISPSTVNNGWSSALDVGYAISPRSLWMPTIPGTRLRFAPLPERIYWNYTTNRNENENFQRLNGMLIPSNSTSGRTAFVNFGGDFRPIDLFHHHFEAVRNLTLGDRNEKLGSINFGRVVTWRQNMDARYTVRGGPWFNPTMGWTSLYSQDNRPELSPDLSVRAIGNGQTLNLSWSLPFDRLKGAANVSGGMPVIPTPREMLPDSVRAAQDSARARRPRTPFSIRDFLSRLGNVSTEASWNRSSSYSRLTGIPSFLYLAGISDDPGLEPDSTGRMRQQFGNNVSLGSDWRTSARTRVLLGFDATLQARGEFSGRRNELNAVVTRSVQSRFPDLEIEYGRVVNVIRLDKFFSSPRLRTAYNRSQNKEFRSNDDLPTAISTSSSWSPLISLDGDLKNRTRVGFKIERRVTERENFQNGHSIATDRNTDVNVSLSRSYSKGQKVKVFLKETTVRTSVNLGLTGVYSRRSGETRVAGQSKPQFPVEEDRVSINANGSYSFSSNVTGNLQLGFGQNRDLVKEIVRRNVRVEVRASFNF